MASLVKECLTRLDAGSTPALVVDDVAQLIEGRLRRGPRTRCVGRSQRIGFTRLILLQCVGHGYRQTEGKRQKRDPCEPPWWQFGRSHGVCFLTGLLIVLQNRLLESRLGVFGAGPIASAYGALWDIDAKRHPPGSEYVESRGRVSA